jgi:hypothetical protein
MLGICAEMCVLMHLNKSISCLDVKLDHFRLVYSTLIFVYLDMWLANMNYFFL